MIDLMDSGRRLWAKKVYNDADSLMHWARKHEVDHMHPLLQHRLASHYHRILITDGYQAALDFLKNVIQKQ